jgi:hypothetical protein
LLTLLIVNNSGRRVKSTVIVERPAYRDRLNCIEFIAGLEGVPLDLASHVPAIVSVVSAGLLVDDGIRQAWVIVSRPTTPRGLIHQARYLASQFSEHVGWDEGACENIYLPAKSLPRAAMNSRDENWRDRIASLNGKRSKRSQLSALLQCDIF